MCVYVFIYVCMYVRIYVMYACVYIYIYLFIFLYQLKSFRKLSLERRNDEFFQEILFCFPLIICISLFGGINYFKHLIAASKYKLIPVMKYNLLMT